MGKAGTKFTGRANGITSVSNRYDDDDDETIAAGHSLGAVHVASASHG